MTSLRAIVLLVVLMTAGCAGPRSAGAGSASDDVERLAALLTGWFDSTEQAARAPDDFLGIRLVMLPIWTDRADGRWLYVEQAALAALDRPYRQRVYRVHEDAAGTLRSDVYTLPGDPLAFAAAWRRADAFARIAPDDLDLRDGCSIVLTRYGIDVYNGGTVGAGCASTLRGASYASSEVTITPDRLVSWDRGWNDAGEQVWGATAGGYEFLRRGTGPPPS